ncbi:ATP-binding protein [Maridesulfovibrio sp. FT414]|uniref:sensor histidine kinase n=1 Tax=Maridesulfovibrio sp. FT414 TaxID=2979469 RepID=UPI003D802AB4
MKSCIQTPESCPEHVMEQHRMLRDMVVSGLIDSVPSAAFVVNSEREVVLYNKAMDELISDSAVDELLCRRPGEIFHCGNAVGCRCGESNFCAQCGVMTAMCEALAGRIGTEECTLLTETDGMVSSFVFKVTAAPLVVGEQRFGIVYLTDISDRKNKEVVEKIFLHDLMNAVNGIASAGSLLMEEAIKESTKQLAAMIIDRVRFMANEINAHRLFVSAENKQLEVHNEKFFLAGIVDSICTLFSASQMVLDKKISIVKKVDDFEITTDKRLLYRILENLIKNAIEASPTGGTVTVEAVRENDSALLIVNNHGVIPITVASQIFKRSFSTKGKGRGLGTYSVKMFTENYLQGRAWFDSSSEEGTNFYIKLPITSQ